METFDNEINRYLQEGRKYYIYGAQGTGLYCFDRISKRLGSDAVSGFIETDPQMAQYCGKRIFSFSEINVDEDAYIILASANHAEEMKENLQKIGMDMGKVIVLDTVYAYLKSLERYGGGIIKNVCFWPPIGDSDEDVRKKIAWFLPDRAMVTVWCEGNEEKRLGNNVYVGDQDREKVLQEADVIFVWDLEGASDVFEKYKGKAYVADPGFWYYTETMNISSVYYKTFNAVEKGELVERSKSKFLELKAWPKKERANIFCSGSSIEEIYDNGFQGELNIISNSMVKNDRLLKKIEPRLLVFSDVNFYVSPNEYCSRFYEDVLKTVRKYETYIIVFDYIAPLVCRHFPQLKDRVIGIPYGADMFVFPDVDNFHVKKTGNILTELMLPIASALCDEIGIAGCTGRNPDETYYWRHNSDTQYLDLMQSVFDMYPSVFRDQKYDNYYSSHCRTVEEILEFGEKLNKRYVNMTTSYIPALKKRSANKDQ